MVTTTTEFLTLTEIIDDILDNETIIHNEAKLLFKELNINDLIKLNDSVGKKIATEYDLWNTQNSLIFYNDKIVIHPKDLTLIILRLVWEQLNINPQYYFK